MSIQLKDPILFVDIGCKLRFSESFGSLLAEMLYENSLVEPLVIKETVNIIKNLISVVCDLTYGDVLAAMALANRIANSTNIPDNYDRTCVFEGIIQYDCARQRAVIANFNDMGIASYLEQLTSMLKEVTCSCDLHNTTHTADKLIEAINSVCMTKSFMSYQRSLVDSFYSKQPWHLDPAVSVVPSTVPMQQPTAPAVSENSNGDVKKEGNDESKREENTTMSDTDLIRTCKEVACVILMFVFLPNLTIAFVSVVCLIIGSGRLVGSFSKFFNKYFNENELSQDVACGIAGLIVTVSPFFVACIGFVDCSISIGKTLYAFARTVFNKLTVEGASEKALATFKKCFSIENIASIFIGPFQGAVGIVSEFCKKLWYVVNFSKNSGEKKMGLDCRNFFNTIDGFINAPCVSYTEEPLVAHAAATEDSTQQKLTIAL